jgi:hypothetical protein
MPKETKHTKDEIYKSIMGGGIEPAEPESMADKEPELTAITDTKPETTSDIAPATVKTTLQSETPTVATNDLDELTHKSYYITKRQFKAIKMRIATSDSPEDKDHSSVVRAALNAYLAEDLKRL